MKTYVLDSSALIRYIDGEAGADRVEAVLKECVRGQAAARISALQWGEVAGNLHRRLPAARAQEILNHLLPSEVEIVPANADRATQAAVLKIEKKIGYADAFALELAMDPREHVLLTADYEFKNAGTEAAIEFLPAK
jgi:predicted nucleic acid-binding protein